MVHIYDYLCWLFPVISYVLQNGWWRSGAQNRALRRIYASIFVQEKIQDSKAFIRHFTDINHTNQRNNVKTIKYLLMCTYLGPSLRPYGHYHKDHQRMFVSTRRIVVSKYDSNDNKTDQCLKDLSSLHHKLLHGPVMTVKGFTWNKVEWN